MDKRIIGSFLGGAILAAGVTYFAARPNDEKCQEYAAGRANEVVQQYNATLVQGAAPLEDVSCALEVGGSPAQYAVVCEISGKKLTLIDGGGMRIGGIETLVGQPAVASVPVQPEAKVYGPGQKK